MSQFCLFHSSTARCQPCLMAARTYRSGEGINRMRLKEEVAWNLNRSNWFLCPKKGLEKALN